MFNANNVLDLLVEALREGGEVRLREFAKEHAEHNLSFDFDQAVLDEILSEILVALNAFDKAAALALIEGAPDRLRAAEQDDEDEDEDEDEDSTPSDGSVEARVTALETEVERLKGIAARLAF
jgi:hypothetical protein